MNNRELAEAILKEVGGAQNIHSYANCMTRLRLQLKDESKANRTALNELAGVLGTQQQGNQFQIILGGKVLKVANEFNELVPMNNEENVEVEEKKKGGISNVLNTLSSILTPALPPIIAGGLLKGLIFMVINFGWANGNGDTIIFFNGLSDCMFYFFPFLLAVSSAKKFKTNEYMALALAGLLMYPFAIADGQQIIRIFGFVPIAVVDYSASVLPIIFSVWLLKHVKRFFDAKIPEMVNMVFSSLLSLVITAPIAMCLLAPLGYYTGEYVALGVKWLIDFSPLLSGLIIGSTRALLVLGGMHHALNPIMQQEISSFGGSQLLAMVLMSTIAQATATLVIYFRAKQTEEKQVALSAVVPAYLGITEPAIYGVLIKYRGALIAGCIGGGVGAAVSNVMGGVCYGFVMPGLLSLPAFMGKGFFGIIVGMIVTIVVSAVLTFILMNRFNEKEEPEERTEKTAQITPIDLRIGDVTIQSPVIGEIVPLESISDATFSNEILGKTIAISSLDGTIYAPFDAEVKAVFPTKHAIGLESLATGAEILIHVGLDTVTLDGKGFNLKVKQGDKIEKGQTILTFDKAKIRSNQLNDVVLVVLTNSEQFKSVDKNQRTETINLENDLFSIIR
ncbi:glucose PTS transporter subunit IIA [Enterococcus malodoratus]|uniref:glucose PTS transporter subunit IIA n=1 Tax=Enterococcus malodoratus TaxID=71451 RepID=UPI003FD30DB6